MKLTYFLSSFNRSISAARTVGAVLGLCLMLHGGVLFAKSPAKPIDDVKLKEILMRRGIGHAVKVNELDGTSVTGVLTAVHDASFDITPRATLVSISVSDDVVIAVHDEGESSTVASRVEHGFEIAGISFGVLMMTFLFIVLSNFH